MNHLTNWAFRNKASIILIVIITLLIGVASYFRLPMEFLPQADNPQVSVVTFGQGQDAGTMADSVTEPIETAVSSVKGKSSVLSTTGDGYSQVNINFESGIDMDEAKKDVEDALNNVRLPEGVGKPAISQLDTSMIPVGEIALTFKDGLNPAAVEKAKKEIVPELKKNDSISRAEIFGETAPRIMVKLDPDKLAEKHIPLSSVMGLLQGQNLSVSVGSKPLNGQKSTVKVTDNLSTAEDLKQLQIPVQTAEQPGTAAPVKLGDIATIKESSTRDAVAHINGKETLALVVFKNSGASTVTAGKAIDETVKKINKDYPDVKAKVLYTTGDMVKTSVMSMVREVLLGALFATIVILLFLRRLRPTAVTIVSIPLSLCLTLFLLWVSGVTLNILTLGGVAVAVGRLVDDSIVVVENIYRRSQKNAMTRDNLIAATREVSRAITSSTLITVAVFLPMGIVNGSLKAFLLPFGLTVTYSLLSSLLVALTVVPMLSLGLLKGAKLPEHRPPARYLSVLRWALNHKWVPVLTALVVFVSAIGLYVAIPKGAISADNAELISINMAFPSDTPRDEMEKKVTSFEKRMSGWKGYEYIVSQLGNSEGAAKYGQVSDPNKAAFSIIMKKDADTEQFINKINKLKSDYPDAVISAAPASMFGSGSTAITYDITGNNLDDLLQVSEKVQSKIKNIDGVNKVSSNEDEVSPVYTVKVNTAKANTQQVAMQLRSIVTPQPIGTITDGKQSEPVYLDAGVDPDSQADLEKLTVATASGLVPVSDIASVTKENLPSTLLHKNGKPFVRISAEVDADQLSVIAKSMDEKVNEIQLPDGVKVSKGGAADQQASDFADLGMTMLASILIVYLIMVLTFKTLRAPLAILMTLPLASIGAVLGLLIFRVPADPTALIGGLMLIGIVVTNAIVLIDRVKQNEEKMPIREAILEACSTRLRPVIMTAVATIGAMLPLVFSHSETGSLVSKSLAVVVIGGLTVATALTLVIVPVFYELLHFRKAKKQRRITMMTEERKAAQ